ncbi:MAG: hypothetical protein ACTIDY_06585 [Halomonadaceae bacterium]|uniref:Uncharacterized protein n=1 Tax=Halomonas colorata TaxID=2742615 RepID=A0ABR9FYI8_9GAMM|nr:hypothetical protein [Halomonas colorata]MBE0463701.1 hypothetical protein [Halomonas colorata]
MRSIPHHKLHPSISGEAVVVRINGCFVVRVTAFRGKAVLYFDQKNLFDQYRHH